VGVEDFVEVEVAADGTEEGAKDGAELDESGETADSAPLVDVHPASSRVTTMGTSRKRGPVIV
jgi:hypothetical protein